MSIWNCTFWQITKLSSRKISAICLTHGAFVQRMKLSVQHTENQKYRLKQYFKYRQLLYINTDTELTSIWLYSPDLKEVSVNIFSFISDFSEDKFAILDIRVFNMFPMVGQNLCKILEKKTTLILNLNCYICSTIV